MLPSPPGPAPFALRKDNLGKAVSDHERSSSELALPESWAPAAQAVQVGVVRVAAVHGDEGGPGEALVFQGWQGGVLLQAAQVRRELLSLGLVASVLEPNFHLGLGELQVLGQVSPFRGRQVLLVAELPL